MAANPSSPTSVFPSLRRKSVSKAAEADAKQKRELAVREAKQYVRDVVRVDWAFDPPPTLWSSSIPISTTSTLATAVTTSRNTDAPSTTDLRANVLHWRMRDPASSESDSDLDPVLRHAIEANTNEKGDPYRFENPDAIKSNVLERGRRRREESEQEMKWNPGLRFFMERRDIWTGVRRRRSVQQRQTGRGRATVDSTAKDQNNPTSPSLSQGGSSLPDAEMKIDSSEDASSSARLSRDLLEDLTLSEEKSRNTTTTTDERLDPHDDYEPDGDDDEDDFYDDSRNYDSDDSMIPVMGPFISDTNCVRSSVTPNIYASLYSKVIVQGLTPTIPINLSDVTKALVAGWKADGQWPPKPTIPPPGSDVPVRKKSSKAAASSKNDDVTVSGVVGAQSTTTTGRKPSFSNQATSAVKKVLGFSNNSFHIRRSSRSSTTGEPTGTTIGSRRRSVADGSVADMLVEEENRYPYGLYS